jgi:hypothetical protein
VAAVKPHISEVERGILMHALGRDAVADRRRRKKMDYRNAYVCGPDSDSWDPVQRLVELRLMMVQVHGSEWRGGMSVFCVTEAGKAAL